MITDIILKVFGKDLLIKRNFLKTVSWQLIGSVDTILLGWLISQHLSTGAKIGLTEFITKMILYYIHERFWQRITWGLPSRHQQVKQLQDKIGSTLFEQVSRISRTERERLNQHQAFTIWLTGLSGSGKSTLAIEIEEWIFSQNGRVYVLDGDNTRQGINKDLSFSAEDRSENIRRVAELCKLFNDAGIIVIASFISPFEKDRSMAIGIVGEQRFTEVYLEASLAACQHRDTKGLYKKALEGKVKDFTGISSPYEPPIQPALLLNTETLSIEQCTTALKQLLIPRIKFIL